MNDNWIPVSDTEHPHPIRFDVLVLKEGGSVFVCYYDRYDKKWRTNPCNRIIPNVTHWMHFPKLLDKQPQTFSADQFDPLFGKQAENDALLKDETKPTQTL